MLLFCKERVFLALDRVLPSRQDCGNSQAGGRQPREPDRERCLAWCLCVRTGFLKLRDGVEYTRLQGLGRRCVGRRMREAGCGKAQLVNPLAELGIPSDFRHESVPLGSFQEAKCVQGRQSLFVVVDHSRCASVSRSLMRPRLMRAFTVPMASLSFSAISFWVSPEKNASSRAFCCS